jgi:hypothetical protein
MMESLLVPMLNKQLEWMTEKMLALQLNLMMESLLVTMLDKQLKLMTKKKVGIAVEFDDGKLEGTDVG